jgi:hypothetical protein
MQFLIPLRNAKTGEEKNFHTKQQVADFLDSREDDADWEGHAHLGALPEPTPVEPEEAAPEGTEPPALEAPASNPVARAVAAVKKAVTKKPAAKKAAK